MHEPLTFISDPGHGWLEVPLDRFPDALDSCSGYGYMSSDRRKVYLEEDMELGHFLHRHPEVDPSTFVERYQNTFRPATHNPANLTFEAYRAECFPKSGFA